MDPRFFNKKKALTSHELWSILIDANLLDEEGGNLSNILEEFADIRPLHEAGPQDMSFFHNARYMDDLSVTRAGLVFVPRGADLSAPSGTMLLPVLDVHRALALVGNAFLVSAGQPAGIHPSAHVSDDASVHPSAFIGPFAHVDAGAEIGADTYIGSHVTIGPGVVIGTSCQIDPQVTISHSILGNGVHLKPGATIGQRGFGWALSPNGHVPKPQVGRVIIGSNVEIGANTAIDRGSVEDTVIGDGTVIDNLCHIAHNCKIGRNCALAANTAFAGTTILGDFVQVGGAVASKGHVHVGDGAVIRIGSFIGTNIPAGADVAGNPARPIQNYHRLLRYWSRIARGAKGA